MKSVLMSAVVTATLLGCPSFAATDAEIKQRLAGKTISNDIAEFSFRRNGRITGKAGDLKFKGAWTARNGKFCRTFSEPEEWAGTECQPIEFGSGTVTITGRNGPILYNMK